MNKTPFVVTPEDRARAMDVLGVKITVLASNAQTQSYEITLQEGEVGVGPPPHFHEWDESFFVLDGQVEIDCEGKTLVCNAGTLVHVPAGTVHGYRFGVGGGRMFELTGQGGCATQMFANVSREVPPGPPDIPKLLAVLRRNGVTLAA